MDCPDQQLDEKIALRRIRVINHGERTTAVVASFFSADRVLRDWWRGAGGRMLDCDFEICYDDGVVLSGHYHFTGRRGRLPALMSFVCKHLADPCPGVRPRMAYPLRGLTTVPSVFLARYETADFALPGGQAR